MPQIRPLADTAHCKFYLLTYLLTDLLCKLSATEHGGSWKRMYFERRLWRLVETFVPRLSDPEQLIQLVAIGSKFVRRMEISELMPPVVRSVSETADTEDTQKGKCEYRSKIKHSLHSD